MNLIDLFLSSYWMLQYHPPDGLLRITRNVGTAIQKSIGPNLSTIGKKEEETVNSTSHFVYIKARGTDDNFVNKIVQLPFFSHDQLRLIKLKTLRVQHRLICIVIFLDFFSS